MDNILSFVTRKTATNGDRRPQGTPASIIIFPGVRYERRMMMEAAGGHLPSLEAASARITPTRRS